MSRIIPLALAGLILSAWARLVPVASQTAAPIQPPTTVAPKRMTPGEAHAACMPKARQFFDMMELIEKRKGVEKDARLRSFSEQYNKKLTKAFLHRMDRVLAGEPLPRPSKGAAPPFPEPTREELEITGLWMDLGLEIVELLVERGETSETLLAKSSGLVRMPDGSVRHMTKEERVAALSEVERAARGSGRHQKIAQIVRQIAHLEEALPPDELRPFNDPDFRLTATLLSEEAVQEISEEYCDKKLVEHVEKWSERMRREGKSALGAFLDLDVNEARCRIGLREATRQREDKVFQKTADDYQRRFLAEAQDVPEKDMGRFMRAYCKTQALEWVVAIGKAMVPSREPPAALRAKRGSEPERVLGRVATSFGSGFLLRGTPHILTSLHVVEGAKEVRVSFPSGESYTGRVVAKDANNDLAVVQLQGMAVRNEGFTFDISAGVEVGEEVHALGYPLGPALSRQPSLVSGQVSAATGPRNNIAQFRMTTPINEGNSGGPVINSRGVLVGIAASGFVKLGVEAVRFGTKVSAAALILGQARLVRKFDIRVAPRERSYTPQELFREFSPYVVLVETK